MKLHNHSSSTLVFLLGILFFLVPHLSFAATMASTQANTLQASSTAAELNAELSQISAELPTVAASSTATFTLSPGQSIEQSSSTPSGGLLKITLPHFAQLKPDASMNPPQSIENFAVITLQYMPCLAASPSVCIATPSAAYPVMTSDLASGQLTGYLHYLITLTNLSSTTATFQVTDSSYLSDIQNQLNTVAAQVRSFLGE